MLAAVRRSITGYQRASLFVEPTGQYARRSYFRSRCPNHATHVFELPHAVSCQRPPTDEANIWRRALPQGLFSFPSDITAEWFTRTSYPTNNIATSRQQSTLACEYVALLVFIPRGLTLDGRWQNL